MNCGLRNQTPGNGKTELNIKKHGMQFAATAKLHPHLFAFQRPTREIPNITASANDRATIGAMRTPWVASRGHKKSICTVPHTANAKAMD